MSTEPVVIVGAGPAGLATARSYREHGGQPDVLLLGDEPHPPYQRPPLTKEFLRGELNRDELVIEDERWFAEPIRPQLPGLDDERVLTMRKLEDSIGISEKLTHGLQMLVLGTGFIGCEIAASAAVRGARVTLVGQEPTPQEQRLGREVGHRLAAWLQQQGIHQVMDSRAAAVHDGRTVELQDGCRLTADLVVLGMGVQPRAGLASEAGLVLSDEAVVVDSRMRASGQIYAAGDAAVAYNRVPGRPIRVEHWGDALGPGEVVRVLAGDDAHWDDVPGFWSAIGNHTLNYAAWGDGYDHSRLIDHGDESVTVWYERDRKLVGVLTHGADHDHERGSELIARGEHGVIN